MMLNIFYMLLIMCIYFLKKCLTDHLPIFRLSCLCFTFENKSFCFFNFWIPAAIRYMICKYFVSFYGLSFHFLDGVLLSKNFYDSIVFQLLYSFTAYAFSVLAKKLLPKPRLQQFYSDIFFTLA